MSIAKIAQTLIVAFAACGFAVTAAAQNAVTNPGFDSDFAGWTTASDPQPTWSSIDCCGNPASGSVEMTVVVIEQSALDSNCMAVTGGMPYDVALRIMTRQYNTSRVSAAGANVIWFDDASCTQPEANEVRLAISEITDWRQLGTTVTAPAGAVAAKVELQASGSGLSSGIDAFFDDVRFGPTGSVPVELQSFDVE